MATTVPSTQTPARLLDGSPSMQRGSGPTSKGASRPANLAFLLVVTLLLTACLTPSNRSLTYTQADPEASTITVATWNIAESPLTEEHIAVIESAPHIDVLLLQEIMVTEGPLLVTHEGSFPPFDSKILLPVNPARDGKYESQAILVRGRIDNHRVLPLEHSGEKRRVALLAEVELHSGERLVVVNTDHEISLFGLGPRDRQLQVNSLVEHLSGIGDDLPVIVGGDFNSGGAWFRPFWGMTSTGEITGIDMALAPIGFSPTFEKANRPITFFQPPWPVWRTLDMLYFRDVKSLSWETHWHPHLSDHALVVGVYAAPE